MVSRLARPFWASIVATVLLGTSVSAAQQSDFTIFCAVPPVRVGEWTPIMLWSDAKQAWEAGPAGVSMERRETGGVWKPWGVLPFGWPDAAPFGIGPTATIAPRGPQTVGTGKAVVYTTKVAAAPLSEFEYGVGGAPLTFVTYRSPGSPDRGQGEKRGTLAEIPAPYKPYRTWLRSLRCVSCSIDIRTPTGWARWHEKSVVAGETYRVRKLSEVRTYAVIPDDTRPCSWDIKV